MAQNNYYPHVIFAVSHHKKNEIPNSLKRRQQLAIIYPSTFYMGDDERINFIQGSKDELGIQLDVKSDQHIKDITKRGATVTLTDTTPDKLFKSHNRKFRIEPGEYKAIQLDMGDGSSVCIKCGLYMLHEDHCVPKPGESQAQFAERMKKEFLPIFCSMKPIVEKYERIKKLGSPLQAIEYAEEFQREINFYNKYYRDVKVPGLNSNAEKENYDINELQ